MLKIVFSDFTFEAEERGSAFELEPPLIVSSPLPNMKSYALLDPSQWQNFLHVLKT